MKKSMLLVMVALFAVSAHAQDGGSKSLTIYADGNSGIISPDTEGNTRTFVGNEVETGLTYNQSFGNGLSYFIKGRFVGKMLTDTTDIDGGEHTATTRDAYEFYVDGFRVQTGIGYGINGFSTSITLNSHLLATASLGYSMSFGNAGSLALGTDAEFYMIPGDYLLKDEKIKSGYGSKPSDMANDENWETVKSDRAIGMLDLFQIHVGYTIPFAERWAFNTKAMFRFNDDDNAFAFADSFAIRWDNTISVKATDNLSIWANVRYNASNLAKKVGADDGKDEYKAADVQHDVYLRAGMSYRFDF